MVSLADDSHRSGAYFFEDRTPSIQTRDLDDPMMESSTLSLLAHPEKRGNKINTAWLIGFHVVLLVILWVAMFVLPVLCKESLCGIGTYPIMLYVTGGGWFLAFAFDRYYRYQHYYSRIYGFLEFYRKTRNIRRLPLMIYSATSTVVLIGTQLIEQFCTTSSSRDCMSLSRPGVIQILVSVSCAAQLVVLIIYLARTVKFNRSGASPDVNQEEMVTSFLQNHSGSSEVGFRDENMLDQVLERQADMIRYLKQSNTELGRRILTLTEENKQLKART